MQTTLDPGIVIAAASVVVSVMSVPSEAVTMAFGAIVGTDALCFERRSRPKDHVNVMEHPLGS